MAKLFYGDRFCIDTSSLIILKNQYPINVFPSVWTKIKDQIKESSLISPIEVFNEIKQWEEDELHKWAKEVKKELYFELNEEQTALARDIVHRFPKLVDVFKTIPEADPFVIALAQSEGCVVITEEKGVGLNKIPGVCREMDIPRISLLEYFNKNKWEF